MTDTPLVSIAIPVFNGAKTIIDTINSVRIQTYSNIEICIVDDLSSDETIELIETIKDSRLKVFKNDRNYGLEGNWERAREKVSGKYVKILCQDDLIKPNCIEKELSVFLENEGSLSIVASESEICNEKNEVFLLKKFKGRSGVHKGIDIIVRSIRSGTNIIGAPGCVLFDNDIANKTTGIDIEKEYAYLVDLNFYIKLLLIGDFYIIKEPLFQYKVSQSTCSWKMRWIAPICFNRYITKMHKDKYIKLSIVDRFSGRIMAWLLAIARNIVFFIINRKHGI